MKLPPTMNTNADALDEARAAQLAAAADDDARRHVREQALAELKRRAGLGNEAAQAILRARNEAAAAERARKAEEAQRLAEAQAMALAEAHAGVPTDELASVLSTPETTS